MSPPSKATLKKYGMTSDDWLLILHRQEGVCAVCKKVPNGRLCIDHDHIRGWKKLPPEKRKVHVRGLLCWFCNHAYVGRCITAAKSRNVTAYLEAHANRMAQYAILQMKETA